MIKKYTVTSRHAGGQALWNAGGRVVGWRLWGWDRDDGSEYVAGTATAGAGQGQRRLGRDRVGHG